MSTQVVDQMIIGRYGRISDSRLDQHRLGAEGKSSRLVSQLERIEFGYTELSETKLVSMTYLKTSPALSKIFETNTRSVPGLSHTGSSVIRLGLGLEIGSFLRRYSTWLAASPDFRCGQLVDLNRLRDRTRRFVEQRVNRLPPVLQSLDGLLIDVEHLQTGQAMLEQSRGLLIAEYFV